MSVRTTIIIPSPADIDLLAGLWSTLEAELDEADELVLVDDSGTGAVGAWADGACPRARVVTRDESGGPVVAIAHGAAEAAGPTLVVLQPEVRVEPGFLTALLAAFEDPTVVVAAPRLEDGASALQLEDGRLHVVPRDLGAGPDEVRPLPFAPLAAFAVRREALQLDTMMAPQGWADVDLGLATWRAGGRVVEVPGARAARDVHRAAEAGMPEPLARASREKNALLTLWKYVDTKPDAHDHVASLWRDALDAAIAGRREELVWMALALQELPRVHRARGAMGPPSRALDQVLRISDPLG